MRKLGLISVVAVLLAACGSTKTVTVGGSTGSSTSPANPSTGAVAGSVQPSAVAACFKAGGATVRGPRPAGRGTAIYATGPDGATLGFVAAPNAQISSRIRQTFASSGNKIVPVKNDPAAFGFYEGKPSKADLSLLSKCIK